MPARSAQDPLNSDSNIEINESHNLLFKLYATLLTNSAVQNGLKQITRFSQPLLGKFDGNLVKLTSNVSRLVSHDNMYNQFANIWLALNYPVTGNIAPIETFAKEFNQVSKTNKRLDKEAAFTNFYEFASAAWRGLTQPSLEEVKNTILEVTARALTKTYSFQDDSFATALYKMLRMLIEKRRELVSTESYQNLIKTSLGDDFYFANEFPIKAATNEYYTFAKRFIFIDFPLATNNKDVLKLILNFVQDSTFYYGDFTLNFVEKRLNFLLKALGQPQEESVDDHTITEKAQRVFGKMFTVSTFPFKKIETAIHQVPTTKAFVTLDNFLHINDKIDDARFVASWGYNLLKENILEPGVNAVKVVTDKTKSQVTVIIHGLDVPTLKKRYTELHARYEVLQKCVVIVTNETVKLIFDKVALAEMEENGRKELNRLYQELRSLQPEKVKNLSLEYYSTIRNKALTTYNTARRAVYRKKREEGDYDGANAIRPAGDKELDTYDDNSHPHNSAGRNATLEVAMEYN